MQKKLLILGGTKISEQILYAAKEMGLMVYVADYNEDSPCKKLADKSFLTSATDVDGIVNIIKSEAIDGVIMGYADVLLAPYYEICRKAGIPCYANGQAIEITSNKKKFKEYCALFNIPVVDEYSVEDVKNGNIKFPLVVKPVDNSGARGIFICHNMNEFNEYYSKSLSYSKSHHVVIERMMNCPEATIFYYLHDGEAYLIGVGDRWMYKQNERLLKLPVGYTFPSVKLKSFIKNQDAKIKSMFKSLGMNEGMVFMQSFVEDEQYTIYEMGYRFTGSIEHHIFEKQYGFNHLKSIIDYSIGNYVDVKNLLTLDPSNCCMANVTLLLKPGVIAEYRGIDEILRNPSVLHCHISYNIGKSINTDIIGTLAQVGIRVLLVDKNREDMLKTMDKVKDSLYVISETGEDMLIKDYSYFNLCQ